jgi:hypothetical protein
MSTYIPPVRLDDPIESPDIDELFDYIETDNRPPSRRYKYAIEARCQACSDPCGLEFSTCRNVGEDEIWDRFIGIEGKVYFCSEAHREMWLEDLYLK